jgi:hypothetical protein
MSHTTLDDQVAIVERWNGHQEVVGGELKMVGVLSSLAHLDDLSTFISNTVSQKVRRVY